MSNSERGVEVGKEENKSLAEFISERREKLGLSQTGLARKSNLPIELIEDIESSKELFLASTVRQKLAKGLKLELIEIKRREKFTDVQLETTAEYIDAIKEQILNNQGEVILCPICGMPLEVRISELYDLEDNKVLHPHAHCRKCVFQIR